MSIQELVDQIDSDVPPQNTGEFALLLKDKVLSKPPEIQKIMLEQFEAVGIIIMNIPCKRIPT